MNSPSHTVRVITADQRGPKGFTEVEFGEVTVSTSKGKKKKQNKEEARLQALVDQALADSRAQAESSQPQYTVSLIGLGLTSILVRYTGYLRKSVQTFHMKQYAS